MSDCVTGVVVGQLDEDASNTYRLLEESTLGDVLRLTSTEGDCMMFLGLTGRGGPVYEMYVVRSRFTVVELGVLGVRMCGKRECSFLLWYILPCFAVMFWFLTQYLRRVMWCSVGLDACRASRDVVNAISKRVMSPRYRRFPMMDL